jgi:hypothetical protein
VRGEGERGDLRAKPHGAQHPERVILEDVRARRADAAARRIAKPARGVEDPACERIVGDGVEREVAPQDLPAQRAPPPRDEVPYRRLVRMRYDDARLRKVTTRWSMRRESGSNRVGAARGAPAARAPEDEVEVSRLAPSADRAGPAHQAG